MIDISSLNEIYSQWK